MYNISESSKHDNINIYFGNGISTLTKYLDTHFNTCESNIYIITDEVVYEIYKKEINDMIKENGYKKYIIPRGEHNKNINTVTGIYEYLIEEGANRNSVLVALGGGVVGDLVGYAAATYMRGVSFVSVPTTLISQVDSSFGGKVGYNHAGVKNVIGTFYDAKFIYINPAFLKTLPKEQFLSGMGEVIKYGFIRDASILELIETNHREILSMDEKIIALLLNKCVSIKKEVVDQDFKDLGIRNILNFGHTAGHAIESESSYTVEHGLAVALGMLVAVKLSVRILNCPEEVYHRLENILSLLGMYVNYSIDNYKSILYSISRDKKNDRVTRFVLLEDIGRTKIKVEVKEEDIKWAMDNSINRKEL